ncbi:MAG: diacylglycerol kinase family protein [Propioniciclava sp.]
MRRFSLAPTALVGASVLFAGWTWLTFATNAFSRLDDRSLEPGVTALSPAGQILSGLALVSSPVMLFLGLAVALGWAVRHRLNHLAWAMGLAIPLVWGGSHLAKLLFGRMRPPTALPLITAEGYGYPSGHMMAITAVATLVISGFVHTRQRRATVALVTVAALAAWALVFYDRWALRAHWFSDLVGGSLLGLALAALCLTMAGVRVAPLPDARITAREDGTALRAAIIVNPTKIPDPGVFRRHVEAECRVRGWAPPLWLETEVDDAGRAASRRARRRRVDLVVTAGGDGTVRTVLGSMAGTDIPIAVLPLGTANLLARNLGIPLDLSDALDVALDGDPRPIDLVQVRADAEDPEPSAVMAGMGADAALMQGTSEDLKRMMGAAAYVVAVPSGINHKPFGSTISFDSGEPIQRTPRLVLVSNVGRISQLVLSPDARPDDGLMDIAVASPKRRGDWALITTSVLTRAADNPSVERAQVKRVLIETDEPIPYQIDGDAIGSCRRFEAALLPRAVRIMVPST